MKISLKGGGGFAGSTEQYQLDTDKLAHGQAIEALLQNMDFFGAPEPPPVLGADIPHWEITVDDGQQCRTVDIYEDGGAACAHWKPLVERLRGSR